MRAVRYALEEAFASLWRGRQAGLLSTADDCARAVRARRLPDGDRQPASGSARSGATQPSCRSISRTTISPEQRRAVEAALAPSDVVAAPRIRVEAGGAGPIQADIQRSGSRGGWRGQQSAAGVVRGSAASGPGVSAGVDGLASRLRQMGGVADVRYDQQWLDPRAVGDQHGPRRGAVPRAGADGAAALTVANVVRLALYARRDELEIMDLVGAPPAYVRGPVHHGRRAPGRHRRTGRSGRPGRRVSRDARPLSGAAGVGA